MTFKNMKFRVKDEDQSRRLQEVLFGLGYEWSSVGDLYLDNLWNTLYIDSDDNFIGTNDFDDESIEDYSEQDTETFIEAYSIMENCTNKQPYKPKTKLINVLGKLYRKDAVEAVLDGLEVFSVG